MLAWVTSGFVAPGVHAGSGRPLTEWHDDGIVKLDEELEVDEGTEEELVELVWCPPEPSVEP